MSKDKKYVICHADYPCDEYEFGKPVDHQQVIWNRERISNLTRRDRERNQRRGHVHLWSYASSETTKFANQMYIDTGAVFCGNLTLIQVQEKARGYKRTKPHQRTA